MPPSETFMRNNQNYRQAGDWRFDRDSRYTGDGYRRSDGQKKIMGYSQKQGGKRMGEPSTQPSSLNEFFYRQEGYSPKQSRTLSRQLAERGYTKGFGGQGIEPNRGMSDRERAQIGLGQAGGGKGGFKRFRGPTDDQRKWSRKFQESQTPRTTPTPSAADQGMGGAMSGSVLSASPTSGPAPAPNFSRAALVQGAKKSGEFDDIREAYNRDNNARGYGMGYSGAIIESEEQKKDFARSQLQPAADEIAARRDFARRDALQETSSRQGGLVPSSAGGRPSLSSDYSASFSSKYGSGSGVAGKTSGAMADPLTGKTVPMREYLPQQSAVQKTKEPGNTSGESYYDPKKIRSSMQKGKA
jgi:hypothetical protein